MQLFSWLRRLFSSETKLRVLPGDPRLLHYSFAHVVVPEKVFGDDYFIERLRNEEPGIEAYLWSHARSHCFAARLPLGMKSPAPSETSLRTFSAGNLTGYVISLPKAEYMIEALMVAIVLETDSIDHSRPPTSRVVNRWYYTLELGMNEIGQARSVLCSWNAEHTHANYGDGPPPEENEFVQAVFSHIKSEIASRREA